MRRGPFPSRSTPRISFYLPMARMRKPPASRPNARRSVAPPRADIGGNVITEIYVALIIAFFGGYLLGSVPFGLLFAHLAGAGDVRKIGSGNIGATNVLRTGKKWAAAATLLCDAGKGALAVILASAYFYPGIAPVYAGLGAFLGHVYPIWLRFRGGKGVATHL